ncbi:hypothetical protein T484DRAFT_1803203, partial [Baffinella frigidus]
VPAQTVGSSKQVASTDADGLCPTSAQCYSRCKATDSEYGVLGQFKNVIELIPGFAIPANKRVVIEMTQVRMPGLIGLAGAAQVKIMRDSAECSVIQVSLLGPGTCQLDVGTFGAFALQPAVMPQANAKVSPRSLNVAQSTEYNVLFYSAAGIPKDGAITLTLPPGTIATGATVNGAAISGKVRTASGKNVFLKSPASSKDGTYTGTKLAVIETKAYLDGVTDTATT